MQLRTILCPVDFSDLSATETEVAVTVAREFGARLVLHHDCAAIPPGIARQWDWESTHGKTDSEAQAERRMHAALNALPRDLRAEGVLSTGSVTPALLALAAELPADLIVLGSHGWSTETHASVTERIIAEAPCPVLTFNEGALATGRFRLRARGRRGATDRRRPDGLLPYGRPCGPVRLGARPRSSDSGASAARRTEALA